MTGTLPVVGSIEMYAAMVMYQRSNCRWDSSLRVYLPWFLLTAARLDSASDRVSTQVRAMALGCIAMWSLMTGKVDAVPPMNRLAISTVAMLSVVALLPDACHYLALYRVKKQPQLCRRKNSPPDING